MRRLSGPMLAGAMLAAAMLAAALGATAGLSVTGAAAAEQKEVTIGGTCDRTGPTQVNGVGICPAFQDYYDLIGLGLSAGLQTASGSPSLHDSIVSGTVSNSVPAATKKCGQGQHWVPAGYARHGKYRAGHCAPN